MQPAFSKLFIIVSKREYKRLYKFLSGEGLKPTGFFPSLYIKGISIIMNTKGILKERGLAIK